MLLPDDWEWPSDELKNKWEKEDVLHYSDSEWARMEEAGAVCLPSAGEYDGEFLGGEICYVGISMAGVVKKAEYWSNSFRYSLGSGGDYAAGVFIWDDGKPLDLTIYPARGIYTGCSIRLVTDVK